MTAPIPLPDDVVQWVHEVFTACNDRVTRKLAQIPTVHETSLDLTFIEHLSQVAVPRRLPSEWVVRIDTHYLGGGRHFGSWEIADIGVIVMFRRGGRLVRSKVALLQSKRLYPFEQEFEEDQPLDYVRGFGRLLEGDEDFLSVTRHRSFSFSQKCCYKVLVVGDQQYRSIAEYEKMHGIPVQYLLYNPPKLPYSVDLPLVGSRLQYRRNKIGCRVLTAEALRTALKGRSNGYAPCYADLAYLLSAPFDQPEHTAGWRLEHFIAQLLIRCEQGYIADNRDDEGLFSVFNERTGPISAAIGITFDSPE